LLLLHVAVIGFGVIQTNHSPVFHYTGELCNTLGEIITFSYLFYKARENGSGIRSILNVYRRRTCPTCGSYVRKENLGLGTRVTFWCPDCQD
ncbi:MAG: hypothetical protein M1113_05310, partial [Candidatus Thermoplasmatota archaeon]|nr:hypothetical protein [Candidatus Thermoplasmatota archaeon]